MPRRAAPSPEPPVSRAAGDRKAEAWAVGRFADVLLQRAALVARVERNRAPDPLAGLKVDDADLAALLAELPGLEPGDAGAAAAIEAGLDDAVAAARDDLAAVWEGGGPLASVARAARLEPLAAEVLALICAVEADPRRQRLVGYLNDDVTARRLTLASLAVVLRAGTPLGPLLGPGGRLRRAALLAPLGDLPFAAAAIVPVPAVMWWLAGDEELEPELTPGTELVAAPGTGTALLVAAAGRDRRRRIDAARAALAAPCCLVSPLPESDAAFDALIRQATLRGAGVVVECEGELSSWARERLERADHLAVAVASPTPQPLARLFRRPFVEADVDDAAATPEEWAGALPGLDGASSALAATYRLSAEQLDLVARATDATGGDVAHGVRRLAAGAIDTVAVRTVPTRGWDDLVLEGHRLDAVREIALRQRQRGRVFGEWGFSPRPSTGVVALFAGPSGTGKTLAAEIVAGECGVDLYKVDLANLVSKYIGETEKNLARIFDAAEASRVVLFFDEADALLGKRSEVADAHDRYANIEVAYLLQRLETYEGVAVLATNLANNLDSAFLRRLHVIVEFPLPKAAERRRIWERSLPRAAPRGADLDLDRLADEVEVSGGTIRNVAVRAAFLAADAGSAITMAVMLEALRRELEKLGRLPSAPEHRRVFEGR